MVTGYLETTSSTQGLVTEGVVRVAPSIIEDTGEKSASQACQRLSPGDIVPDEYQTALISLGGRIRDCYFAIGDLANDLVGRAKTVGFRVTQADVYHAVGSFCGKSGRTVRYYAEVSGFYPPSVRDEFEILPFSHFVFARSLEDRWREILEFAALHPTISEDGLRIRFIGTICAPVDAVDLDSVGALEAEPEERVRESGVRLSSYAILSRISSLQESTNYLRDNMLDRLAQNARTDAERALGNIEQAVKMLLLVVDKAG